MSTTRTTITIQTQQRIVVRHLREPVVAHCERCVADVTVIAPEYLVSEMNLSPSTLRTMLDQDVLHAVETSSGTKFICCGPPVLLPNNSTEITEENRDEDFHCPD